MSRFLSVLLLGSLFGFLLVRAGATAPDAIAEMFLLRDLHLAGVIAVAILVAGGGFVALRRWRPTAVAPLAKKPSKPGNIAGGLLFGTGWALTGLCPGTALAQLGQGALVTAVAIVGIFAGTALYLRYGAGTSATGRGSSEP